MRIKILLSLLMFSFQTNAQVYLFDGTGDYANNEDPLGVKVYRGDNAQRIHQSYIDARNANEKYKKEKNRLNQYKDNYTMGSYKLKNIPDVYSYLFINEDGTFYWSMKYEDTYLNTAGSWVQKNNQLLLNTDVRPQNINFTYKESLKLKQQKETEMLGGGDLAIKVSYKKNELLQNKGGIKDVEVECIGMYGKVNVITNDNGEALCKRVGFPLISVTLKYKELPNISVFEKPSFDGLFWNFEFDMLSAHAEYYFNQERFNISGSSLIWNGRTLGANQEWVYEK